MVPQWEYKTHFIKVFIGHMDTSQVDEMLNEDGAKGWELVSVTPVIEHNSTLGFMHHFRRPKESERKIGFSS